MGELRDHDAPELVNFARVDAVRVCRVAELVRVTHEAKQIRDEELKTHCLLVATNKEQIYKITPLGVFFCFDLVVVARAYWVMGCRVAELLHANPDAKQNTRSRNDSKTLVPLASKTNHSKNTREFFQHEPAPMLIVKGSRVFVSRFAVKSQFVPRHHRRTRGLWRAAAHRPSTAPQPSTAQPHTLIA